MFKTMHLFLEATHDSVRNSFWVCLKDFVFLVSDSQGLELFMSLFSSPTWLSWLHLLNTIIWKRNGMALDSIQLTRITVGCKFLVFLYLQIVLEVRNSSNTTKNDIVSMLSRKVPPFSKNFFQKAAHSFHHGISLLKHFHWPSMTSFELISAFYIPAAINPSHFTLLPTHLLHPLPYQWHTQTLMFFDYPRSFHVSFLPLHITFLSGQTQASRSKPNAPSSVQPSTTWLC